MNSLPSILKTQQFDLFSLGGFVENLDKLSIALFGHFPVLTSDSKSEVSRKSLNALNLEVALYGYTLSGEFLDRLSGLSLAEFRKTRENLHSILKDLSGSHDNHNVLFAKFPHETPDQWEYLAKRVLTLFLYSNHFSDNPRVLDSGLMVDGDLFDMNDFGVDPVTQYAIPGKVASENVKTPFQRASPLKLIELATNEFLLERVSLLLARGSSLSADEREFIESARGLGLPARPDKVFRENLPIVYSFFKADQEYIASLLNGATDVLRIAVMMSDPKADLSLSTAPRFKLRTSQRKELLRLLESMKDNRAEDMLRHREVWLRLGERLNPNTAENQKRFPKTAEAFVSLRNFQEKIPSFNRTVVKGLAKEAQGHLVNNAMRALISRPGEAMRRQDWVLRRIGEPALSMVAEVAEKANTRSLFNTKAYFVSRNMDVLALNVPQRVFSIKGVKNTIMVIDDTRDHLESELIGATINILDKALQDRLSDLPSLGKVYIDPELQHRILPINRRGDSSSITPMTKGSAYPMEDSPVLRMFVHWTGKVDIDLSMNSYDDEWKLIESIGFYNTNGDAFAHSGDVRNAPKGASEFIDVDFSKLKSHVRYLVPSVISYSGHGFDSFPCYVGYMGRDALRSGKRYEPESVSAKFNITAKTHSVQPVAFDLVEKRAVYMDITTGGGCFLTALGEQQKMAQTANALLEMRQRRVTLYDVASAHTRARGVLVNKPEEADTILDINTDIEIFEAMTEAPLVEEKSTLKI